MILIDSTTGASYLLEDDTVTEVHGRARRVPTLVVPTALLSLFTDAARVAESPYAAAYAAAY